MKKKLVICFAAFAIIFGAAGMSASASSNDGGVSTQELPTIF
ncbi:hypothetical protein [Cytobacillus gottheilii]|nr:hypothetical protein [Cytobacillus gottheilii]